jgi:hypothetical protein
MKALSVVRGAIFVAVWAASVLAPAPAQAGDVTAFVAFPSPTERWNHGFGAALSSTWFNIASFEGEAARVPGETTDTSMSSFTVSALLSPPIGVFTPYGGLGIGLYRQSAGDVSNTGRLKALIVGAKVKLGGLVVLKAEYRKYDFSDLPLVEMDSRVSAGAGLSF